MNDKEFDLLGILTFGEGGRTPMKKVKRKNEKCE
jgi:hypothetical protein